MTRNTYYNMIVVAKGTLPRPTDADASISRGIVHKTIDNRDA